MVRRLEPHERKGKDKELREAALLLKSARDLSDDHLFHATDDPKVQQRLANELAEWADREDSVVLDSFPLSKRINPRWFYNMAKNNTYFAQCLEYARARIGERLEMKLQGNPVYQLKALPIYSTPWADYEEKKQEAARATQATVVERYIELPNCGLKEK